MSDEIQVALISTITAVFIVFIRDIAWWWYKEHQSDKKNAKKVFNSYVDPLSFSLEPLLWRLDEILNSSGRGVFLREVDGFSEYVSYKKISTVYRLCVVIAWIRAYQRELSFLPHKEKDRLESAIGEFSNALADGVSVEEQRLTGLMQLWFPTEEAKPLLTEPLGIEIENIVDRFLHDREVENAERLTNNEKTDLVNLVSDLMADKLQFSRVPEEKRKSTLDHAVKYFCFKEAWIFRDWQSAIGDSLIVKSENTGRIYDVVGYGDFEKMFLSNDNIWIKRIYKIFKQLDVRSSDKFDARTGQLKRIRCAVVELIITLDDSSSDSKFTKGTIEKAIKLKILET